MRYNTTNLRIILITVLYSFPLWCLAVTQKEMEQARTIAAKSYIRYVNDGSGYLDDLHPATIEELQKSLKPKEKENIKAFLAIAMPSDYQSWDKTQLIEYWAGTVFKSKGLVEKGRGGRILARKELNKMTVSAPAPEKPATSAATAAPVQQPTPPVAENPTVPDTQEGNSIVPNDSVLSGTAVDEAIAEDTAEDEMPEAYNYTWVYIMVLAILVAIVIALVVYASNVMKKNATASAARLQETGEADDGTVEKYESALADKEYEISMLTKKLENANKQNSELKTKLEALTSEIAALRSGSAVKNFQETSSVTQGTATRTPQIRTIYLGRANVKQIFIRADRTLNVGNSVFVLDTSDGLTGSFRVADSPAAWSLALSNPDEYLKNACTGHDLDDTNGASKIVTESSGTAIFEGGCWKVIRKAKIRYE